ncbi:MAG: D-galactarate dehydratase [Desulfobacterales bacterium RIFOXYA12_FULL_46_15]|nr:MAG: D-galactarate dehydratase [Desulfobacula sp. GWF2_41_7]OGR25524.1 MAG: D-galactarate dehydratase [Desulfobacterales bacterium RIFOXYA12_FULL_46_15]
MKRHALVIKDMDNVATAIQDLSGGQDAVVGMGEKTISIQLTQAIALGHKFAVKEIAKGGNVVKYNSIIGRATRDIKIGEHAHVHNMESLRGRGDL